MPKKKILLFETILLGLFIFMSIGVAVEESVYLEYGESVEYNIELEAGQVINWSYTTSTNFVINVELDGRIISELNYVDADSFKALVTRTYNLVFTNMDESGLSGYLNLEFSIDGEEEEDEIVIIAETPLWQNMWFWAVVIAITAGAIVIFVMYSYRK